MTKLVKITATLALTFISWGSIKLYLMYEPATDIIRRIAL